jgi:hypothetical protein
VEQSVIGNKKFDGDWFERWDDEQVIPLILFELREHAQSLQKVVTVTPHWMAAFPDKQKTVCIDAVRRVHELMAACGSGGPVPIEDKEGLVNSLSLDMARVEDLLHFYENGKNMGASGAVTASSADATAKLSYKLLAESSTVLSLATGDMKGTTLALDTCVEFVPVICKVLIYLHDHHLEKLSDDDVAEVAQAKRALSWAFYNILRKRGVFEAVDFNERSGEGQYNEDAKLAMEVFSKLLLADEGMSDPSTLQAVCGSVALFASEGDPKVVSALATDYNLFTALLGVMTLDQDKAVLEQSCVALGFLIQRNAHKLVEVGAMPVFTAILNGCKDEEMGVLLPLARIVHLVSKNCKLAERRVLAPLLTPMVHFLTRFAQADGSAQRLTHEKLLHQVLWAVRALSDISKNTEEVNISKQDATLLLDCHAPNTLVDLLKATANISEENKQVLIERRLLARILANLSHWRITCEDLVFSGAVSALVDLLKTTADPDLLESVGMVVKNVALIGGDRQHLVNCGALNVLVDLLLQNDDTYEYVLPVLAKLTSEGKAWQRNLDTETLARRGVIPLLLQILQEKSMALKKEYEDAEQKRKRAILRAKERGENFAPPAVRVKNESSNVVILLSAASMLKNLPVNQIIKLSTNPVHDFVQVLKNCNHPEIHNHIASCVRNVIVYGNRPPIEQLAAKENEVIETLMQVMPKLDKEVQERLLVALYHSLRSDHDNKLKKEITKKILRANGAFVLFGVLEVIHQNIDPERLEEVKLLKKSDRASTDPSNRGRGRSADSILHQGGLVSARNNSNYNVLSTFDSVLFELVVHLLITLTDHRDWWRYFEKGGIDAAGETTGTTEAAAKATAAAAKATATVTEGLMKAVATVDALLNAVKPDDQRLMVSLLANLGRVECSILKNAPLLSQAAAATEHADGASSLMPMLELGYATRTLVGMFAVKSHLFSEEPYIAHEVAKVINRHIAGSQDVAYRKRLVALGLLSHVHDRLEHLQESLDVSTAFRQSTTHNSLTLSDSLDLGGSDVDSPPPTLHRAQTSGVSFDHRWRAAVGSPPTQASLMLNFGDQLDIDTSLGAIREDGDGGGVEDESRVDMVFLSSTASMNSNSPSTSATIPARGDRFLLF